MKLYRTSKGNFVEHENSFFKLQEEDWDRLLNVPNLLETARDATGGTPAPFDQDDILAPVVSQEVWAAGVTYYRSRDARMEESKDAGGGTFYDRVYMAERPEIFFKCAGWRAVRPGGSVRIRRDATWSVPEPELTLVINAAGKVVGYTLGNDMSSRDIEGENPLYLPQAKVYNGSCAIGPAILLAEGTFDRSIAIELEILRGGQRAFRGTTSLEELKREPSELVEYLFREMDFPAGAYLMTGTGIVPPDNLTLASGDVIRIISQSIGTLENTVA
jgi:2-dehydro-3-deoxy-D-arabinonate dehydratase